MSTPSPVFHAQSPEFETLVRDSFQSQPLMNLIGAKLVRIEPGAVDVEIPFQSKLTPAQWISPWRHGIHVGRYRLRLRSLFAHAKTSECLNH